MHFKIQLTAKRLHKQGDFWLKQTSYGLDKAVNFGIPLWIPILVTALYRVAIHSSHKYTWKPLELELQVLTYIETLNFL